MGETEGSQPMDVTTKIATEELTETPSKPKYRPADVDVSQEDHPQEKRDADEKSFEQLRTPKHANKTIGGSGDGSRDEASPTLPGKTDQPNQKITPDRDGHNKTEPSQNQYPTQDQAHYGAGQHPYFAAGEAAYAQYRAQADPHYAARLRMMQQQQQQGAPQQVSPGSHHMNTAAYRPGGYSVGYNMQGGYQLDSHTAAAYRPQQVQYGARFDQPGYRGQLGQYGAYRGYGDDTPQVPYGQGLPPSYHGRPPYGSQQTPGMHEHDPRYAEHHHAGVTRAVSSSFDRSTKSTGVTPSQAAQHVAMNQGYYMQQDPHGLAPPPPDGHESDSDDDSWRQLKQVTSVDDETALRARAMMQKKAAESRRESTGKSPPSNSSSLTNSPTDGHVNEKTKKISPSKMGLDSLSSVASEQEPIDTTESKNRKASKDHRGFSSPGGSSSETSLDLMKCHSGSSGLLPEFRGMHGRSMSGTSFEPHTDALLQASKRPREDRGDADTKLVAADHGGRHDLSEDHVAKKSRVEGKDHTDGDKTGTRNEGSPHDSDSAKQAQGNQGTNAAAPQDRMLSGPRSTYTASPAYMGASYFDGPPSHSYSLDSAPSKEYTTQGSYAPLPPRPGSSASSTITPVGSTAMQIDGPVPSGDVNHGMVGTVPSWDMINAHDSFGAGSIGGSAPLVGSFSFSQDYGALAGSGSNVGQHAAPFPVPAAQPGRPQGPPNSVVESRNQSFDGGQYHGIMAQTRTGNMEMPGQSGAHRSLPEGYKGHQGPFPPQAHSWGTASSTSTQQTFTAQNYSQYRVYPGIRAPAYGAVARNYSDDSAMRISPPGGPTAAGFQPPSDFLAPPTHLIRRPPPSVFIMSSGAHKKNDPSLMAKSVAGVYGWSQEEDDHLSEIMKKYKNPRDWEPIAKEHGFNKSPKECHERWIRYLKPGVRKGQWTDQEDAIVVEAVTSSKEQPFTRWSDLAQKLPGRVGKQIRDRWVNHLNPNINHMPFSKKDDLLLWEGHKQLGKRWVEISAKWFKSSRSENHIKNRWYSASFKKFISNEFGPNAHSGTKGGKGKGTPVKKR